MIVFEIRPQGRSWTLTLEGGTEGLTFPTFTQTERRARWLAMRQEVKGVSTEIRMLDADGALVGAWRGERYDAALHDPVLSRVA